MAEWPFIDGYAVSQGIELLDLPLARFTNFIWWMMIRNAEKPSDVEKMKAKLWIPPKGEEIAPQSPWSPENETSAFAALKAGLKT